MALIDGANALELPASSGLHASGEAIRYSAMIAQPDRLARVLSLALLVLSVAAAALSLFPAIDWYRDANPWTAYKTTTVGTPWVALFALPAAFALRAGTVRWALAACGVVIATYAAWIGYAILHFEITFDTQVTRTIGSIAVITNLALAAVAVTSPIALGIRALVRRHRQGVETVPANA